MTATLRNIWALLPKLVAGMFSNDFEKQGSILVSWSPVINSVNDHTGFYTRKYSFGQHGYWGYCPKFGGGSHIAAAYPFFSSFFTWKLGVSGYTLLTLIFYVAFFALLGAAAAPHPWLLAAAAGLLALYSPYFKNSTFTCGRHDTPGWPLLLGGFLLLIEGCKIPAFSCLAVAFMTHPALIVAGGIYTICFIAAGLVSFGDMGVILLAVAINGFWMIPFRYYGQRVAKSHSWALPVPQADPTRSIGVKLKKGFGMLVFIASFLYSGGPPAAYVFCLVPFGLFAATSWKERFINRFSIELLWLCGAAAACALADSPLLWLAYLFSLYFYASPSPRFAFPFKPLLIPKDLLLKAFQPIRDVAAGETRIAFTHVPQSADQFRTNAKYEFLFNAWLSVFDHGVYMENIGFISLSANGRAHLDVADKMKHYGIHFILTPAMYSDELTRDGRLIRAAECILPAVGSVPGVKLVLLKLSDECSLIEPEGELSVNADGSFSIRCNPGKHRIKYDPFISLRAFQGKTELVIEYGGDRSFFINPASGETITIKSDLKKLWLPNLRISGFADNRWEL